MSQNYSSIWTRLIGAPALLKSAALLGLSVVLLNAPYWVLSNFVLIDRPGITYESVLVAWLLSYGLRWALPMGVLFGVVDVAVSLSKIYLFSTPTALLKSIRYGGHVNWRYWLDGQALAVAALLAAFVGLAWFAVRRRRFSANAGLLVLGLAVALDMLNGSFGEHEGAKRVIEYNVAGTTTVQLISTLTWAVGGATRSLSDVPPGTSAKDLLDWPQYEIEHPDGRILIVIVESLGEYVDTGVRDWLYARLDGPSIRKRYEVHRSLIPFEGSTTSGELRTLCRLKGDYRAAVSHAFPHPCLPSEFTSQGWETAGFHGFTGDMFSRRAWWPKLGLQSLHFGEEIAARRGRKCGRAFRGACDEDVLDDGIAFLQSPSRLAYVLTVNTHLPLGPIDVPEDLQALCERAASSARACQLVAAQGAFFQTIRDRLERLPANTVVLVIGDHAPPFSLLSDRQAFNRSDVPAFLFVPLKRRPENE